MTVRHLIVFIYCSCVFFTGCQPDEVKNPDFSLRFIKLYGGSEGQSASECRQLIDGGYVTLGTANGPIPQAILIATDIDGDIRWQKIIGSGIFTRGMSLELEPDGDIVVACQQVTNRTAILLQIYSQDGTLKLTRDVKKANSSLNYAVQRVRRTPDGQLCFSGSTNDTTGLSLGSGTIADTAEFLIYKTNPEGVVTHAFGRGFTGVDIAMTACQSLDGSIFMTGSSRFKPINEQLEDDMIFIKGSLESDSTIGYSNAPSKSDPQINPGSVPIRDARDMVIVNSQEVVIVGNTVNAQIYLSRINPAESENIGFELLSIPGQSEVNSIMPTPDGGYILAATGSGNGQGNGGSNILLIKTNRQGIVSWFRAFGGDRNDVGSMAIPTADGGYLITGTLGFESIPMICLIKTDQNGLIE